MNHTLKTHSLLMSLKGRGQEEYSTNKIHLRIYSSDSYERTLAKSGDQDKIAAFYQGLHCLLRQKRSSETVIQSYLEI